MKSFIQNRILWLLAWSHYIVAKAQENNLPQLGKSPISEVVKAMTLDEKVSLLVGGGMYVPGMAMPGAPASHPKRRKG